MTNLAAMIDAIAAGVFGKFPGFVRRPGDVGSFRKASRSQSLIRPKKDRKVPDRRHRKQGAASHQSLVFSSHRTSRAALSGKTSRGPPW